MTQEVPGNAKYIAIRYGTSYSTVHQLVYIDDLVVESYSPPAKYAKLLSVDNPKNISAGSENIRVSFQNIGLDTIKDIDFSYQIDDSVIVNETAHGLNVAPGDIYSYASTAADFSVLGKIYNIKAWLTLSGDPDKSDDTATGSVRVTDCISSYPYTESFEDGDVVRNCLNFVSMNTNNGTWNSNYQWGIWAAGGNGSNPTPNDGSYSFRFSSYSSAGTNDYRQYITTPRLAQTSRSRTLSFYYSNNNKADESLRVGYSVTTSDLSSFIWGDSINTEAYSGWKQYIKTDIGADVKYIAILYNGNRNYAYIDNLSLSETPEYDGEVIAITSPVATNIYLNNQEVVSATVKNQGNLNLTEFNMSYSINNGTPVTKPVFGVNIVPDSTYEYTFTDPADLDLAGSYIVKVWIDVDQDSDKSNDTAFITLTNPVKTDLRVLSFVDLPEVDTLTNGTVQVPVKIAVRNDSGEINTTVTFNFIVKNENGEQIWVGMGTYTNGAIAKDQAFTYPFAQSITFSDTGNYIVRAWADLTGDYLNLHNDIIEDTIRIVKPTPKYDGAVNAITAPAAESMGLTDQEAVTVIIENRGNQNLTAFNMSYSINNGVAVTEPVSGVSIAPAATYNYTFVAPADLHIAGNYTIKAWIDVAGDSDKSNDTASAAIVNSRVVTDLRVLSFVDLPETDTLMDGTAQFPVKVAVRNDSAEIDNRSVMFNFNIVDISSGEEKGMIEELYTAGVIAKDNAFTYTFDNNASFVNIGSYKIKAWVDLNDNYLNLHNDTIERTILIVKEKGVGNETAKSGLNAVIYPNPSNGVFTVTVPSRSTVEIIDVRGVVIDRIIVDGSKEFSLKGKGLYLLRFVDNGGRVTTQRILIK
jgi:hypothetical protein